MTGTDLKFFTNEPERDLYSRFSAILKSNTQFFDVLVGYFRTSGFFKMYEALEGILPEEHLKACLLYDYYRKTKNRPSVLFYSYSDKTYLRKSGKFNLYELEHYAVYMPFYSKKRMIHQLVVYHRNNEVCQHYLVDEENNRIEEIKL